MTRAQRKIHLIIWIVMALVLAALVFVAGRFSRERSEAIRAAAAEDPV